MTTTVEGAGVELAIRVRGDGPGVLLVHAMASDAIALDPVAERLAAAGARAVAYDRRGYGASGAPEPYGATTVEEQAEDAAAVIASALDGRAVVAGDGFGALVALDLMKRRPELLAGAVLAEPPLFAFVPDAAERLAAERAALEDALRAGGPPAAVAHWLGERADADALDRAQAAARAFFADFAGLASWPVTRGELRAMATPAVVLTGPSAPPHVRAAAEALAGLLPAARRDEGSDLAAAALALL